MDREETPARIAALEAGVRRDREEVPPQASTIRSLGARHRCARTVLDTLPAGLRSVDTCGAMPERSGMAAHASSAGRRPSRRP